MADVLEQEDYGYTEYQGMHAAAWKYLHECTGTIDKWLLSLSSGGLVFGIGVALTTDLVSRHQRILLGLAVAGFVCSVLTAMVSKGLAYLQALFRIRAVEAAHHEGFMGYGNRLRERFSAWRFATWPLILFNCASFLAFVCALLLMLFFAIATIRSQEPTSLDSESNSMIVSEETIRDNGKEEEEDNSHRSPSCEATSATKSATVKTTKDEAENDQEG